MPEPTDKIEGKQSMMKYYHINKDKTASNIYQRMS